MSEEQKREPSPMNEADRTEQTPAEQAAAVARGGQAAPGEAQSAAGHAQAAPGDAKSAADDAKAASADAKAVPGEAPAAGGEASAPAKPERRPLTPEEREARRQAALAARAAKAGAAAGAGAARAGNAAAGEPAAGGDATGAPPKPPSPNQPRLDRAVQLIRELVAEDAVEEASLNELNDDLPTLVIRKEHWFRVAQLMRDHEAFRCRYLRNVAGVDHETHMEVVYHLLNMESGEMYCVKVRTDRDRPSVPSVTPLWKTADWQEREIYDLLGIDFPGHPDLRRIMLPDDWVGHPLRKDYVPLDPEV